MTYCQYIAFNLGAMAELRSDIELSFPVLSEDGAVVGSVFFGSTHRK